MLTKQKLAEINSRGSRPKGSRPAVYAALGALVGALAAGLFVSYALGGTILVLGLAVAFLLTRRGAETPKVELFYNLDAASEARFSEVRTACRTLAGSEKLWRVDGGSGTVDEAVAPVGVRYPASIGLLETPGFAANLEIWGIEADERKLFFLPECVLSYEGERYQPVSYHSLGVLYGRSRRTEDGEVPGDAEVLEEAGSVAGTNGMRRGIRGPGLPVVAYGLLEITGIPEAEPLRILVSSKARAVRFARQFGAGKEEAQGRDARTAREARARRNAEVEVERSGSLYKILGVEPGASQAEIHAAYKKKAMVYHPDRVASLAPEVREMAELRMKEINAAYGEIKRRRSPGAR